MTANPLIAMLAWGPFALFALVAAWRWRSWRAAAAGHARATRGEAFVHGVVEADAPPVTVEIDQQRRKNGDWEQTAVRARIAPFGLRSPSGELVWVAPDRDVVLMWPPDQTRSASAKAENRVQIAQLVSGTTVDVFGIVTPASPDGAPYRDGSTATLTPPRHGPMLISKLPLRVQYARMAAYQVRRIGPVIGLWLVIQTLIPGLWRSDLALVGVASAPTWVAVGSAIAGVVIAAVTGGGAPPWSTGPLDTARSPATPDKQ